MDGGWQDEYREDEEEDEESEFKVLCCCHGCSSLHATLHAL